MQFISDYSNINNVTVLSNNINFGTHMGFPSQYIIKLSACHHPLINLDHKTLGNNNNNNSNCFEVCVCK